jgi:hypothetical protein
MTSSADNNAGAPISCGVSEAPGWGYQRTHPTKEILHDHLR